MKRTSIIINYKLMPTRRMSGFTTEKREEKRIKLIFLLSLFCMTHLSPLRFPFEEM